MQMGVMITDGGPHPAEKWAVMTAQQIFPLSDGLKGDRHIQATKVQLAIMEALEPHHADHQTAEQDALGAAGDDHLDTAHNPGPRALLALETVKAIVLASPWADKVTPEWEDAIGGILASHFATSADIERQWFCHRNPSEKAKAFLASRHGGAH